MIASKVEFVLGKDIHGREVRLTREHQSNDTFTWSIARAPHDQRDDSPVIRDLPDELMHRLAGVVGGTK